MIAGERVRLKADAPLRVEHPKLADAVGTVSSIVHERGNALVHVRHGKPLDIVVLNAAAAEFEAVDRLEPRLSER